MQFFATKCIKQFSILLNYTIKCIVLPKMKIISFAQQGDWIIK